MFFKRKSNRKPGARIARFTISSGDFPIRGYCFDGQNLVGGNRLNFSRDGWMKFADSFFEKKQIRLSDAQIVHLRAALDSLPIHTWKSDKTVMKNLKRGAVGFCPTEEFFCVFEDGTEFSCYPGRTAPDGFNALFHLLAMLCPLPGVDEPKPGKTVQQGRKECIVICPDCGAETVFPAQYCGMCRKEIDGLDLPPVRENDNQITLRICPDCSAANFMHNQYCISCGKSLRLPC